ncbi:unnamed protein product [Eruca vesicaria subsp. sativa]|uniref:Sulfotransferase n=1 Tax=Eruca vesicaria subsp. sativa TaxID=29727 RepID=A0ABC8KGJ8_ERUVS|nr:unnamed protein product [Eruca vesicaria subsp. sativa]
MDEKEIPKKLRDKEENLSEETKSLIAALPSDIDGYGIKIFKYQGCWYDNQRLHSILNYQVGFQPQETDIVVASYPKSGTTWLKALTFTLLQPLRHPLDDHHHPVLNHNPHELVLFLEEIYRNSSIPDLQKLSASPRLFSTHMPLHILKVPFKDDSPCKIVYVCRNVKDVLVSLWLFKKSWLGKNVGVEKCTLEVLFDYFCRGVALYGPFWEHVLSYWRGSLEDPEHVLFMRYEELKTEPHAQIKRLAKFLGCPFTEEEEKSGNVDKILELCALRNLSGLEINKTGTWKTGVGFKSFFRRGEVGDSKNYLTPEMEARIDMIIDEKLKGSGLKF